MDFCVSVFTLPRAEAVELELLVVCLCVRNGEKSLYLWNEFYFHQGLTNQIFKFLQLKEPQTLMTQRLDAVHPFSTWFSKAWKMCHH